MSNPIILGLDPGFSSCGWCLVRLDPDGEAVLDLGVIRTEPREEGSRSIDNMRRTREIYRALRDHLADRKRIDAVCSEAMSFTRDASVASKVNLARGAIAALSEEANAPLVEVSPQGVRRAFGFPSTRVKKGQPKPPEVTKEDVALVVLQRWPGIAMAMNAKGIKFGDREHVLDSLAAVLACLGCEEIQRLRRTARAA